MLYNMTIKMCNPSDNYNKYSYNLKRFMTCKNIIDSMCQPLSITNQFKQVFTSYDLDLLNGVIHIYNITLSDFYNLKRLLDFKQ